MSGEKALKVVAFGLMVAIAGTVGYFAFTDFLPTWIEYNEAKAWFIENCDWNPVRYDILSRGRQ